MERIWQWLWDRHGRHYSWALIVTGIPMAAATYVIFSLLIVASERSTRYGEAVAVTIVTAVVVQAATTLLGRRWLRPVERWAAGDEIDRAATLQGTYTYSRKAAPGLVWGAGAIVAAMAVVVGVIAGAPPARLIQYAVLGACFGACISLVAGRYVIEAALWPVRAALAGDSDIGDALPRAQPSFAAQTNLSMIAVAFVFTQGGAMTAAVFTRVGDMPVLSVVFALALTLGYAVPLAVGSGHAPRLRPIRDLAHGADRVATGDYSADTSESADRKAHRQQSDGDRQDGRTCATPSDAAHGSAVVPARSAQL